MWSPSPSTVMGRAPYLKWLFFVGTKSADITEVLVFMLFDYLKRKSRGGMHHAFL